MENKKDSAEWAKEKGLSFNPRSGFRWIMDPDGWDRRNYTESIEELITVEEFNSRLMCCTISPNPVEFVVDA